MSVSRPELVLYIGPTLLESPRWSASMHCVLCVSIDRGVLYACDTEAGEVRSWRFPGVVGCVVPCDCESVFVACKSGLYRLVMSTGETSRVAHPENRADMRYNDGEIDPVGRVILGSMGDPVGRPGLGRLFQIEGGVSRTLLEGLSVPNGIAFEPGGRGMLFVDSPTRQVRRFHYEPMTGELAFDRVLFEIDGPGVPDGICLDSDGGLWVAEYGGGRVRKWVVDTGECVSSVDLPCDLVTSCCLGGDGNNQLFITTSGINGSGSLGGGLFVVPL